MPIDPNRLTELRKRKRLSRAQLAERSRISQRQIARLESGAAAGSKTRDRTVNELARALDVEPAVLTGEKPMPAATNPRTDAARQVSAWIRSEVGLAYTLIKRRYGVGLKTLINAAPLMFVLLAEGSFAWRRERLKEVEEAAQRLNDSGRGYLTFARAHADSILKTASVERNSIEKRDLFGKDNLETEKENLDLEEYTVTRNSFSDYLHNFAMKIDKPEIIKIWDFVYGSGSLKNFPEFAICEGDIDRFTDGSERLNRSLLWGLLRIDHMPEELLVDDAVDKRQKWLEKRLEEWLGELPEELKGFWEDLLSHNKERPS